MTVILVLKRQRLWDTLIIRGQLGLHSKLQTSQDYLVKSCLKTTKTKRNNNRILLDSFFQFLPHLAVELLWYIVTLFNFSHGGFVIGCLVFAIIDNVVVTFFLKKKVFFLLFLIVCVCVWVCSCEMLIFWRLDTSDSPEAGVTVMCCLMCLLGTWVLCKSSNYRALARVLFL